MLYRPAVLGLAALAPLAAQAAEHTAATLPDITVEAPALPDADRVTLTPDTVEGLPADGGALLTQVNGVSGIRFGGHGLDPVIRGQSQTRLNVLLDGAYIHGGCPNRMDPPSSYAAPETYDRVTVIKGNQSVLYGGGGSGGTVLFERVTPRFTGGEHFRGKLGGGYQGNGDAKNLFADLAAGGETGFVRLLGDYADANDYQDGDGKSVRSAYTTKSGSAIFGLTPSAATRLELSLGATRGSDILFFGGMDSPQSDSDNVRLKFSHEGAAVGVKAELYGSDVKHVMDNYSLRPIASVMSEKRIPSTSNTVGGRVSGELYLGKTTLTLGVDHQANSRDAIQYNYLGKDAAFVWPDVSLAQTGVFLQGEGPLAERTRLKAGLRLDHVTSDAGKAALKPTAAMWTPNQLYSAVYGKTARSVSEDNVGGFLRLEQGVGSGQGNVYLNLSRSVRTADATERFIAMGMSGMMMMKVGNPDLNPEVHRQAEVGLNLGGRAASLTTALYYDDVADFILKDKAQGQSGILVSNGAEVYRNVDAVLTGVEAEGRLRWGGGWNTGLKLAYTYANNETDDRPIAQIPPLTATLDAGYGRASWSLGARVRMAAKQYRIDSNGGDVGKTGGWGVLDLYGHLKAGKHVELSAGVDNVFDRTYRNHLNRANDFDTVLAYANEPGVNGWLRAAVRF